MNIPKPTMMSRRVGPADIGVSRVESLLAAHGLSWSPALDEGRTVPNAISATDLRAVPLP